MDHNIYEELITSLNLKCSGFFDISAVDLRTTNAVVSVLYPIKAVSTELFSKYCLKHIGNTYITRIQIQQLQHVTACTAKEQAL